jgi:cellulose synthase/poly-beta-1,6-N-acetylglucosamine synthase-like glycosyltransferase
LLIFSYLMVCIALILLCGATFLLIEVIAGSRDIYRNEERVGSLPAPNSGTNSEQLGTRVTVLIPAHNEGAILAQTLQSLAPIAKDNIQLLVVADNCTDNTAQIACDEGVWVVERNDDANRGKGYALAFGVAAMAQDPPGVVIVLDADCTVSRSDLQLIADRAAGTGNPVQARYVMALANPEQSSSKQRLAAFAWWFKVTLRQRGLHRLFGICHLSGSGMAFPWATISNMPLGTSHIVEDLVLGLWLARQSYRVEFCYRAVITSTFPAAERDALSQRTRWESGHLSTIVHDVPATLFNGVFNRNLAAFALAIDAAIPPIALLVMFFVINFILTLCIWLVGGSGMALAITIAGVFLLTCAIGIACYFDRERYLGPKDLVAIIRYTASKVGLYHRIFRGEPVGWLKTKRD